MSEWKECTISDIGTVIGGATPFTTDSRNYDNGNIPWITPKDLSDYHERYISRGERNITETGLKSCATQMLPKNTVLFSSRAPIGYVAIASNEVCTNQGFKSVVPNKDVDYLFLYYLLKYNKEMIEGMGSGTTFKEVSKKTMEQIKVCVPKDISVQRKIAGILDSLDSKIELNNQINRNLEEQAQAIFKSWFIDFEPFGGEMPEDWTIGKLSDLAEYEKEKTNLSELTEETYYSTENMLSNKAGVSSATNLPTIDQTTRCFPGETIISNIRPYFKKIFYCTEDIAGCSTDVLCFKPKNKLLATYNYSLLYNDNFFDYMVKGSKGTKMPRGDKSQIMNYEICIPSDEYLQKFDGIVSKLQMQIQNLKKETTQLTKIRDTLLPELMSGDLGC